MEFSENNISTIVSMIVPFITYLLAQIFGFNIDQALLTMFLTGIIELIVLVWSARNPNTMKIFGNAPIPKEDVDATPKEDVDCDADDGAC